MKNFLQKSETMFLIRFSIEVDTVIFVRDGNIEKEPLQEKSREKQIKKDIIQKK